jgi:hypothetical protein
MACHWDPGATGLPGKRPNPRTYHSVIFISAQIPKVFIGRKKKISGFSPEKYNIKIDSVLRMNIFIARPTHLSQGHAQHCADFSKPEEPFVAGWRRPNHRT